MRLREGGELPGCVESRFTRVGLSWGVLLVGNLLVGIKLGTPDI